MKGGSEQRAREGHEGTTPSTRQTRHPLILVGRKHRFYFVLECIIGIRVNFSPRANLAHSSSYTAIDFRDRAFFSREEKHSDEKCFALCEEFPRTFRPFFADFCGLLILVCKFSLSLSVFLRDRSYTCTERSPLNDLT